jgi:hypothetical protein
MELGPSSEANSHSASQEIALLFMGPEGSLLCSQETTTGPHPVLLRSIPALSSHLCPGLPSVFSFLIKILYAFLISHVFYMLHPSYPPDLITLIVFGEVYNL